MKWVSKSKRQIWSMIASVKTTGTCFNFFVWRHLITQFLVWYAGTAKQQYLFNQSHTLKPYDLDLSITIPSRTDDLLIAFWFLRLITVRGKNSQS